MGALFLALAKSIYYYIIGAFSNMLVMIYKTWAKMYRYGPWPEHRAIGPFYSVWLTPWLKLPLMLLFYKIIALFERKKLKRRSREDTRHQTIVPSTDNEDIRLLNNNYVPSD